MFQAGMIKSCLEINVGGAAYSDSQNVGRQTQNINTNNTQPTQNKNNVGATSSRPQNTATVTKPKQTQTGKNLPYWNNTTYRTPLRG